jgi:hypothetical protein
MLHTKNKKKFSFVSILFIVVSLTIGASFFVADTAFAQSAATPAPAAAPAAQPAAGAAGADATSTTITPNAAATGAPKNTEVSGDGVFAAAFKWLLYWLGTFLANLIIVAATVFAWATKPEYISGPTGLLNLDVVYELWKFIRDFFNLTFIFLLLFSAFGTVFQISKFNLKKNFLAIIFAAVAINFSFPITRLVIDAGNVPMYFFAKGIVGQNGGNALSDVPRALNASSGLGDIVGASGYTTSSEIPDLLKFVVFNFIFMITLFMLALMFVIRLITLVILLIFSPMGIAASIVPGLSSYGKKWWSNLFTNVFFGPAAMLMLVVSLKFTLTISGSAFSQGAGAEAAANSASAAGQASLVSQGIFFIPIILMWMAMQTGKKMGAVGASEVTKYGDKALAWGKKQALSSKGMPFRGVKAVAGGVAGATGATAAYKGVKSGLSDRFGKTPVIGSKWRKQRSENREAIAKGFAVGGKDGVSRENKKILYARAQEAVKKAEELNTNLSDIKKDLRSDDPVKSLAAAMLLSKTKGAFTGANAAQDLQKAMEVAKERDDEALMGKFEEVAGDAKQKFSALELADLTKTVKQNRLELTAKRQGRELTNEEKENIEKDLEKGLQGAYKKEGKLDVFLDYKIIEAGKDTKNTSDRVAMIEKLKLDKLSAHDLVNNKALLQDDTMQQVLSEGRDKKFYTSLRNKASDDGDGDSQAAVGRILRLQHTRATTRAQRQADADAQREAEAAENNQDEEQGSFDF